MKDVIGRTEYTFLRLAFKNYLAQLGEGFTWYPAYHYVDCPIHQKADAVLRHEDGAYRCGVCFWNAFICNR